MLLFYALALAIAAGVIGLFVTQILALLGFVPGLAAGAFIMLAAGGVFAAIELLYLAVLRLYRPTRDRMTLATETVSFFATVIFVPYLLHVPVPWPSSRLESAEPFIYLFAFAGLHLFAKLATFYASLEGARSPRTSAIGWGTAALVSLALAYVGALSWIREAERARSVAAAETRGYLVGDEFAQARPLTEGALLRGPLSDREDQVLALRLANLPEAQDTQKHAKAYVTVRLIGDETKVYERSVRLRDSGWAELRVPSSYFPGGVREYEIRWTRKSEPNWQRLMGIRPIVYNVPDHPGAPPPPAANLLLSGPSLYRERVATKRPNILLILIDGLGANHLSMLGYAREVTPSIDRLGYGGLVFPNTYAPEEGPSAALRALLTGSQDARTADAAPARRSIAAILHENHYATAAFRDGGDVDAALHEQFGVGFDLIDVYRPSQGAASEAEDGSRVTLERARSWIAEHSDVTFFCVVRLSELEVPRPSERYENVYPEEGGRQRDVDLFDNALLYLDRQIGALLKYIRDHDTGKSTCIVVTSLYGHDFSLGAAGNRRTMPSRRVPLILHVPGGRSGRRPDRVALADVAATLAALTETRLEASGGRNLLKE